ncbi:MAG: penicillin-binding protein activator [Deltaproteobacteria bacterium]|nr:penicillin-binding protein activator [Deltaproteobacteria bacterium]
MKEGVKGSRGQGSRVRRQRIVNLLPILLPLAVLLFTPISVNAEDVVEKKSYAIGVILPLSGKYASFGEEALKGALLAAGVFNKGADIPIEIVVKDSKDDPDAAAKAVKELAEDERVIAIIGPLLSVTAFEAAKRAQGLKMPIITLSQREGLPQIGNYVFRNFMTQNMQARAAARYAAAALKFKRIAVFYPDNQYGKGLAAPFKDELKMNNVEVVAEGTYAEGQADFSKEIRKLFKVKETEKKEGRRVVKTFNPMLSVDALYMPDYFDTVSIIASHLAYFNIKGVRLLGSNGWNSPRLVELGGKYIEGAVFVDSFFPFSPRHETRLFVSKFLETYGMQAGALEAEAYDAVSMIISVLKNGNVNREDVRNGLAKIKDFKGAAGSITFNADRDALKDLFILTVRNGEIVQVN